MSSITIAIDFAETAKAVMAQIALASVGHVKATDDTHPFANCRISEITSIKAREACTKFCSILAGYVSDYEVVDDIAGIELQLPDTLGHLTLSNLGRHAEKAIEAMSLSEIFASSPAYEHECRHNQAIAQRALSAIRQLLVPR